MIGYFGKQIIFETNDKRIMTFDGLKIDVAARYAKHDVITQKPKTEFIGPDLDTISFTVSLNGNWGIKPRKEMEKWSALATDGTAEYFVIGGKPLGSDKWIVKSVSEAWDTVFNSGELFSGKIDITLEEYIEKLESKIKGENTVQISTSKSAKTNTSISNQGTVTATVLNVREGPGLNYKIIGQLYKNNKVKIAKKSGNWYSIYFGSNGGYVFNSYVKLG